MKNALKVIYLVTIFITLSAKGFCNDTFSFNLQQQPCPGKINSEEKINLNNDSSLSNKNTIKADQRTRFVPIANNGETIFRMSVFSTIAVDAPILLTNAAGKILQSEYVQVVPGTNIVSLKAPSLPEGWYNVQVVINGKTINERMAVAD